MITLKPYSVYKDSGVQWLGYIPDHWEARRLSSLLTRNDSGAWGSGDSLDGVKVLRSTEQTANGGWRIENPAVRDLSPATITKTILKAGDLVVTTSSGSQKHIGKTSIVTETMEAEGYGFSNFMQRLRTSDQILPRLVWYVINNQLGREQLVYWSTTTTGLANLNGRILGSIALPVPPLDEQRAIADFLDGMDARITRFIAARRKMIALLEEKKQAVINQAVTRGLGPSVPMKDSGVDWLGEIPAHWYVRKVGAVTSLIQTGPFGSQLPASEYMDGGVPLINPSHIADGRMIPDPKIAVSEKTAERMNRHRFHIGDIALARRGEIGRCAVVRSQNKGWLCGTGSLLVRPNRDIVSPDYLQRVLSHKSLAGWLELTSAGATMSNLNTTMVASIGAPVPPIDEQNAIVERVGRQTHGVEMLIRRHQREIELMQEYRTRLISDVVTGTLDVRGVELPAVEKVISEGIEAAVEEEQTDLEPVMSGEDD